MKEKIIPIASSLSFSLLALTCAPLMPDQGKNLSREAVTKDFASALTKSDTKQASTLLTPEDAQEKPVQQHLESLAKSSKNCRVSKILAETDLSFKVDFEECSLGGLAVTLKAIGGRYYIDALETYPWITAPEPSSPNSDTMTLIDTPPAFLPHPIYPSPSR